MTECAKAPELAVAAEPPQSATTASEVDKSIPEPVFGQPSAPEQPPAANAPAGSTEINKSEKSKEPEKSDDPPRGLLKEFQNKIAGVFPKKTEKPNETKETKKEETTEDKDESEEKRARDGKDSKERRSASRKRNSIFGGFGLGKKDEKLGSEETPVVETTKEIPTESPVACLDQPSPKPEATASEVPSERPAPTKRASIFDSFRNQFSKKDKVESPTVVTPKEESTPLQALPAVGLTEADKEASTPGLVSEAVQDAQAVVENKVEKLTTKAEKRKTSLHFGLGLGKKEKNTSSDEEVVEKPRSPFAKLRATVKSKTSPKLFHDKKEEQSTPASAPETTKINESAPQKIVSSPESAAQPQAAEVAASA